jgi:hypothetical protein
MGLVVGLAVALATVVLPPSGWLQRLAFLSPLLGLFFGLTYGIRGGSRNASDDIETVEALNWSWTSAIWGSLLGLLIGLLMGTAAGLVVGAVCGLAAAVVWSSAEVLGELTLRDTIGSPIFTGFWLGVGLIWASIGALGGAIIGAMSAGATSKETPTRVVPNQGIWLSLKNAGVAGVVGAVIGMLLGTLSGAVVATVLAAVIVKQMLTTTTELDAVLSAAVGLTFPVLLGFALGVGFVCALAGGLLAACWRGGLDVVQHYVLRLLLYLSGAIPWNYARFLDHCVERILMYRVGGGYIFYHGLLQDRFIAQYQDSERVSRKRSD